MVAYKCFSCGKDIDSNLIRKRVRCPYCGGKILFKPRTRNTTVKAI
ncbi:MAG TPA: DNA-directed RNA polymerase subunit P [Candidatus Woesearchaeota archaeon]|nr:DNA-directed RNA polymerase subunit P [Candidatus Woesearchaeota archaeon]